MCALSRATIALLLLAAYYKPARTQGVPKGSQISGKDVWDQLEELSKFSDSPHPSVTRLVYSKQDVAARKYLRKLMEDAGLTVTVDAVGNTFGRWEGADPSAKAVLTGSHGDSIVLGGRYDGILGIVGGIAAISGLKKEGFRPQRPIEVVQFTSEEGDRFTEVCFGSRIATGFMTADELATFHDENGTSFMEAATAGGFPAASYQEYLDRSRLQAEHVEAFVELHIEQGPLLEKEGLDLGVVTHILGPSLIHVHFNGTGGHAGGMPMLYRKDPALAASEVALIADKAARNTGSLQTVATTGTWNIHPNVFNAVPRGASILIDVRDVDYDRRETVINAILEGAEEMKEKYKVTGGAELVYKHPPVVCADQVLDAIRASAQQLGIKSMDTISKPYHDAALMGQVVPTAMIFIPCRDGLSHHPDEYSSSEQIEHGVKALALTLARLAGSAEPADRSEL